MQTLESIQIGMPKDMDADPALPLSSKPWRSAIFKTPVLGEVTVGLEGIIGDGQADLKHHGGSDKAICVYPTEHLPFWRKQLDRADFGPGAFGENFSVAGLDEFSVAIGDRWRIGTAMFEVSQPRQPCWKLARRWQSKTITPQAIDTGKTGWYLRVIETGTVQSGDEIVSFPVDVAAAENRFSIAQANRLFYQPKPDVAAIQKLLEVPQLSQAWGSDLERKFESD